MDILPLKELIDASIAVVLALVVMYWHRSDANKRIEYEQKRIAEVKERAKSEKEDKLMLLRIIEENTRAITKNTDIAIQILNTCEQRCPVESRREGKVK